MSFLRKNIPYKFKDPSLLDERSFVGGKWVQSSSSATYAVYDPEDNREIGQVADLSRQDVAKSIEVAHEAFKTYRKMPHRERRWLIRKWADLIKENKEDIAAICTLELGKPFTESLVSVKYATDFLDWFEGEIERTYGETIPAARGDNRIITVRQPQGVVAAITPWNSPIAMVTRKVGAAIAAGNTVVCKPAPETPFCAIALAKLFERAGFPPGVLNIVTCSSANAASFGEEMCENKLIRHLSFTGSTQIGKLLNAACAKNMKKTSMELGGNAPFIVFEDAKLEAAVNGLIVSKFRSSGQTCVCANRIFVHESLISAFAARLESRLKEVFTLGSVWDPKTNFGPLYCTKAVEKVARHVDEAVAHGAKIVVGGHVDESLGPNFFVPTVLTGSTQDMLFTKEETFGPFAALIPFKTEEEVVEIANSTESGLAGYFYTEDISRMFRVAEALEVGMVGCRVGLVSACEQPFGGIKDSGIGREGSKLALDDYLDVKSITIGV
ncbi:hypothetical protein V490_05252 [Pseudogymnoascus sp. VKM F-3557]|nr:hypothetical protein V490_05252 [Pseudogymnoascus sp. VKM F-3557]